MISKDPTREVLDLIAGNVRRFRNELDISQEELADRANVHRTFIGMIERSEKNITVRTLVKLAGSLNIPVSRLLESP